MTQLINLLNIEEEYVVPYVLSVLTFLGKYKPLSEYTILLMLNHRLDSNFYNLSNFSGVCLPNEMEELIPRCKNFALTGTKKQAKQAVRCLFVNVFRQNENIFNDIIEVSLYL